MLKLQELVNNSKVSFNAKNAAGAGDAAVPLRKKIWA